MDWFLFNETHSWLFQNVFTHFFFFFFFTMCLTLHTFFSFPLITMIKSLKSIFILISQKQMKSFYCSIALKMQIDKQVDKITKKRNKKIKHIYEHVCQSPQRQQFHILFFSFIFFIYFYQLEANYFTILQWFPPYIDMNQPWIHMCSPSRSPLPPPSPPDPSGSSQCTRSKHLSHASNLGW